MSEPAAVAPDPVVAPPAPASLAPVPADTMLAAVTLRGGDLPWHSVSRSLRSVRWITLGTVAGVLTIAAVVVAVLLTPWVWIVVAALVLGTLWCAWLIDRQVSAITWIELSEELVIRKGRWFRTLVSVPYGRMQFVDVQSGPLMRSFDLATVELHTGSPETSGSLPGLTTTEAEGLRERLATRGESLRAGL